MKSSKFITNKTDEEKLENKTADNLDSTYRDVTYIGFYDSDKTFTVNAKDAFILNEEPHVVYLKNTNVTLYLKGEREVVITSNQAKYNKLTHDIFFSENVKAVEGKTEIFSDNLDLLATENLVKIYNNVSISDITGLLYADEINYDFETKYFKALMFDDKDVKIKMIK